MPSSKGGKKKAEVPLVSMAGLIRYFEEERVKIKVSPYIIIALGLGLAIAVAFLDILVPLPAI